MGRGSRILNSKQLKNARSVGQNKSFEHSDRNIDGEIGLCGYVAGAVAAHRRGAFGLAACGRKHTGRGPAHRGKAIFLHVIIATAAASTVPTSVADVGNAHQSSSIMAGHRVAAALFVSTTFIIDATDVVADRLEKLQRRPNLTKQRNRVREEIHTHVRIMNLTLHYSNPMECY